MNTGVNNLSEWNNSICIYYTNQLPNIIKNSNNFIIDYFHYNDFFRKYQNNEYKIYNNIILNYNKLINFNTNIIDNSFNNDKYYFAMIDSFTFKNAGHNLSVLLDQTNYIITNNIKNVLIYKNFKNTHNFKLIEQILPKEVLFYELEFNNIYIIKNIIIIPPIIANLTLHQKLINNIILKITNEYSNKYNELKNKNIILIKSNRNNLKMISHLPHNCEKLLLKLEYNNWINIIPEDIDIFQLVIYLYYAKNIITSDGCISFLNHIFFNKDANLIYIGLNKLYENILKPCCKKYKYIETILTNNEDEYIYIFDQINIFCC